MLGPGGVHMNDNLHEIERIIDYIEAHLLEEKLDLDTVSQEIGYSKYHLHRMFTSVVGLTFHHYLQRRRLTEAARMLVFTDKPIIEIALCAGYDTQQSFSRGFKDMFRHSPTFFRKHRDFIPLQLKYDISNREKLRGDMITDVKTVEEDAIYLIGYSGSTKNGFHIIGRCWRLLHKNKYKIENRTDRKFLIGVNDYSMFDNEGNKPVFTYIASAQVNSLKSIPNGMKAFALPPSKYVVFYFKGKNEDSLQPVVEYIYREWFPNSTCVFNESNLYDFVKYGEDVDENGESEIQFWVPVV